MGLIINHEPTPYFHRLFADTAFSNLKEELKGALKIQDKLTAARCLQRMGRICLHLNHFAQALDYHLQADKLLAETGQEVGRASNLNDIGVVYHRNKQRGEARKAFNQALGIFQSRKHPTGIASTQMKIGHWFSSQHMFDSGFYYQRIALSNFQELNDQAGIAENYNEVGNIYEDQHRYDSAFLYFNRSVMLGEVVKDTALLIEAINNVGDIYRKTGRYELALRSTRRAMGLAVTTRELFHMGSIYRDMAKTFHALGRDDSAFFYQRACHQLMLDIFSTETSTQLAVLQTLYEVGNKNTEIAHLEAVRRTHLAIVAIVLLLLLCGALIISRQRLRIKNAELLRKEELAAHHAEQTRLEVKQQALQQELELKSRELTTHTLNTIQKNQFLETLQKQVGEILIDPRRDQRRPLKQLQLQISQNINNGQHWDDFQRIFDQVHASFFVRLKAHCDMLTKTDLRLVALLKMNLESEQVATLLGISADSLRVMRHRLRKKMNLEHSQGLTQFIQSI
ncbi:MAG: tetratricopeptide repeat protein [Chitinophagaceae bacterium]